MDTQGMNNRGRSWNFAATASGMVRAGRQAWAPFSPGTPRRSQPCPSLALRLSLPDWERMDACCLKLPHWWSCSQQPWEMHKAAIEEMKKLRSREVKSLARDTQQAGTEVRAVWQPSSFPGQRLVGLANLSHGYCTQAPHRVSLPVPKDNYQGAGQ